MSGGRARGLFSFLIGGVFGAIGGLLLAPRSGKETREMLKTRADEFMEQGRETYSAQRDRLQVIAGEKTEELKGRIEDAKERLKTGIDTAAGVARERVERMAKRAEESAEATQEFVEESGKESSPEVGHEKESKKA